MSRCADWRPERPLVCRGQMVELPEGRYDWLRLELAAPVAAEVEETAWLYYEAGLDPEHLRVAADHPVTAWLPVPRRDVLHGVRLPDRPELVVTAVTLIAPHPDAATPDPDVAERPLVAAREALDD